MTKIHENGCRFTFGAVFHRGSITVITDQRDEASHVWAPSFQLIVCAENVFGIVLDENGECNTAGVVEEIPWIFINNNY
jgi:hypothetical protein